MIILAIETSCDDTCIAVLEIKNKGIKILSNVVSSQVKLHAKYGGVYPFLAKREHQKNLPIVFKKALKEAGNPKIDASANSASTLSGNRRVDLIAVTTGPGLEPCLWTGINFAVDLAKKLKVSLVPINHIEAHILANIINNKQLTINNFPAVCLVISGGHTQLILMTPIRKASLSNGAGKNWEYKIIGETRDDAAGECFDKTARILGLGYPGGPAIAAEAAKFKVQSSKFKVSLPRPMIYQKNYDFSFSGLKTAVLYDFKGRSAKIKKSKQYIQAMAAEIQQSIIDVLVKKTIKATRDYNAKTIILGGGVTANHELRKQFKKKIKEELPKIQYLKPNIKFCTDNAVMIAVAGYFNRKKKGWKKIKADANLKISESQ